MKFSIKKGGSETISKIKEIKEIEEIEEILKKSENHTIKQILKNKDLFILDEYTKKSNYNNCLKENKLDMKIKDALKEEPDKDPYLFKEKATSGRGQLNTITENPNPIEIKEQMYSKSTKVQYLTLLQIMNKIDNLRLSRLGSELDVILKKKDGDIDSEVLLYGNIPRENTEIEALAIIKLWGWAGITVYSENVIEIYKAAIDEIIKKIKLEKEGKKDTIIIHWDGDPQINKYDKETPFMGKFSHAIFLPFIINKIKNDLELDGVKIHIIITKVDIKENETDNERDKKKILEKIADEINETGNYKIRTEINDLNKHVFPYLTGVDAIDVIVKYDKASTTEKINEELLQKVLTYNKINNANRYCILIGANAEEGIKSFGESPPLSSKSGTNEAPPLPSRYESNVWDTIYYSDDRDNTNKVKGWRVDDKVLKILNDP